MQLISIFLVSILMLYITILHWSLFWIFTCIILSISLSCLTYRIEKYILASIQLSHTKYDLSTITHVFNLPNFTHDYAQKDGKYCALDINTIIFHNYRQNTSLWHYQLLEYTPCACCCCRLCSAQYMHSTWNHFLYIFFISVYSLSIVEKCG